MLGPADDPGALDEDEGTDDCATIVLDGTGRTDVEVPAAGATVDELDCPWRTAEELAGAGAVDEEGTGDAAAELDSGAAAAVELDTATAAPDELEELTPIGPAVAEAAEVGALVVATTLEVPDPPTGRVDCAVWLEPAGGWLEPAAGWLDGAAFWELGLCAGEVDTAGVWLEGGGVGEDPPGFCASDEAGGFCDVGAMLVAEESGVEFSTELPVSVSVVEPAPAPSALDVTPGGGVVEGAADEVVVSWASACLRGTGQTDGAMPPSKTS